MMTTIAPVELDDLVRPLMEEHGVPGLAVGVMRDGEIQTWGFGVASIETGFPVLPDTLFQIGSITKVFAATAIMQLVEEGRVDLDAPVRRLLPDFRLADEAATETVTPRHLLTHTGGFFGDRFDDFGNGDDALARAMAGFHTLRQYTAPGETWSYCNTGFQALGAIIERFDETTAERAIHQRVVEPLGLERSFLFPHEAIAYPVAVGHNQPPGKELDIARRYPLVRCMNAAGGIIGTAGDLLRFARFHMGDGMAGERRLLSEASLARMREERVEGGLADFWGLGWSVDEMDGHDVIGHGGSTNGFRAKLTLVPERRAALAVLTNSTGGRPLSRALADWFFERHAGLRRPEPALVPLSPDALARFAGAYRGPTSEIEVRVEGGGLAVEMVSSSPLTGERTTWPTQRLAPLGGDRFVLADGESIGEPVAFLGAGNVPRFMRYHGRLVDRVAAEAHSA